jgi:hypothetical protein
MCRILRGVCRELILRLVQDETRRGIYPEPKNEILHFDQEDKTAKGSGKKSEISMEKPHNRLNRFRKVRKQCTAKD